MTAILVAEDDPSICELLADVLETELAAMVRCEQTGSLALQAIETSRFDLAIIDVNLPDISGYELARRAANRNIPALLSSGDPDVDIKLQRYECPYLAKPYRIADLISQAAEAIAHADEPVVFTARRFRCAAGGIGRMVEAQQRVYALVPAAALFRRAEQIGFGGGKDGRRWIAYKRKHCRIDGRDQTF